MNMHRIIAIDIGANIGWAAHPRPGTNTPGEPLHGSFRLPKCEDGDTGPMLKALRQTMLRTIAGEPVLTTGDAFGNLKLRSMTGQEIKPLYDILIYEAPIPPAGKDKKVVTNISTTEQQYHRGGCLSMLAAELGMQCFTGHIQSVRKHFCGSGFPPEPKQAVQEACRRIGWYPQDHDAADALALFDFACHLLKQPFRRAEGPMYFQSKAGF
ncbi:MAG: hypothetical protein KBC46_03360 [Ferrovibrio sp.]|nr:hypothetical protein [Ferrovibrio sp.]